jgi:hypothetical protein
MSCADRIQLLIAIATLLAVAVALFVPICQRMAERHDRARRIKTNVSMYLDVLELKLEKALSDIDKGRLVFPKGSSFEGENRKNYDAIEQQYLDANVLKRAELQTLGTFVRSFKTSRNMLKRREYAGFLEQVQGKDSKLRQMFPNAPTFKQERKDLLDD